MRSRGRLNVHLVEMTMSTETIYILYLFIEACTLPEATRHSQCILYIRAVAGMHTNARIASAAWRTRDKSLEMPGKPDIYKQYKFKLA